MTNERSGALQETAPRDAGKSTGRDWITIVSGLPRSGTSMMMQLLAAGGLPALTDDIRRADEDNPRGYYEFEAVKQVHADASWLADAEGKVVKMVYRLLYDLPADRQYRVVFMRRKLEEVVASQSEMLRRLDKPSEDIEPARLVGIYRQQLEAAERWLRDQPNFRVHYVDYQAALHDPETVIGELNAFLGGDLAAERMLEVPDRSLYRQRR